MNEGKFAETEHKKKENEAAGEARDYFTAKDSYGQLFPGLSERERLKSGDFPR